MSTGNAARATAQEADEKPRADGVLLIVLVGRGTLSLTVILALEFLFREVFRIANKLPFASTLDTGRQFSSFPENLDRYGELFGFLTLNLFFLWTVTQFLRTSELFFRSEIGDEAAFNRWARRAATGFFWSGIFATGTALYLLTQMSRGAWPLWAVWICRIAWAGTWFCIACAGYFEVRRWRRVVGKWPLWLVKDHIRLAFRTAFFLRVPLSTALLLVLVAPMILGPARHFLEATLYHEPTWNGLWQYFLTVLVSYLIAMAASAQIAILLERGPERFDAHDFGNVGCQMLRYTFQQNALMAASVLVGTVTLYSIRENWEHTLWVFSLMPAWAGGAIGALAVVFAADWLLNYFQGPVELSRASNSFLVLPVGRLSDYWQRMIQFERNQSQEKRSRIRSVLNAVPNLIRFLRPIGFASERGSGSPYPNVTSAIWILLLSGFVFVAAIAVSMHLGNSLNALGSILLLLFILSVLMSSLTFVFDRYHVPILAVALLLRIVFGFLPSSDHWFTAEGKKDVPVVTPREVLLTHLKPVLVAASGGGIQASAWMTTVMERLDRESRGELRKHVALVSGVSGGSVGAFHLGNQWNGDWRIPMKHARLSSLDRVAWATVSLDLFRPLTALASFGDWDRGDAFERELDRHIGNAAPGSNTLGQWSARTLAESPAFLFNATVVETGRIVAFSTTELPSESFVERNSMFRLDSPVFESMSHRRFFDTYCPDARIGDVRVATAVRLSASFPYVSPAARPKGEFTSCNYHFVDGGYYDNFGLVSLLLWLDDGLESMSPDERRALDTISIVIIRGRYPNESLDYTRMKDRQRNTMQKGAWNSKDQVAAPLAVLQSMRSYLQWEGRTPALRLLVSKWKDSVKFNFIPIAYDSAGIDDSNPLCAEEPLSWKLTPAQQRCIDNQVRRIDADLTHFYATLAP